MKEKILYCIIIITAVLLHLEAKACSIWDTQNPIRSYQNENIQEEILPIRNKSGKVIGIDVLITIPEECNEKEITISPSVFSAIKEYKNVMPGDKIKVNIKIINQTIHDYFYVDNSFLLSTEDLTRLGISKNYIDTKEVGFDNQNIYDTLAPYRVWNSAIENLYYYNNDKEHKEEDLSDEKLNLHLQEKGYQGIEELDQYYLDFYNKKYNLQEESLDCFPYTTIKEIFSGPISNYKEKNAKVIALAYNYFYNKLLSLNFMGQDVNDSNSEDYSIGSYMRKRLGNNSFQEAFGNIKSKNYQELKGISLNINRMYHVNAFKNYNFNGHIEWKLKRKIPEEENTMQKLSPDLMIPPATGI